MCNARNFERFSDSMFSLVTSAIFCQLAEAHHKSTFLMQNYTNFDHLFIALSPLRVKLTVNDTKQRKTVPIKKETHD